MQERIDIGELSIVTDRDTAPDDVWLGRPDAPFPSDRFLAAFVRGELTVGGLAEAGWHYLGRLSDA